MLKRFPLHGGAGAGDSGAYYDGKFLELFMKDCLLDKRP